MLPTPPTGLEAPEDIRVSGTGTRPTARRRTESERIPSGYCPQQRCDRGRNRVSQASALQGKTADATLLLPRAAESQRPPSFPHCAADGESAMLNDATNCGGEMSLGGHPKPAIDGRLKTGHRE